MTRQTRTRTRTRTMTRETRTRTMTHKTRTRTMTRETRTRTMTRQTRTRTITRQTRTRTITRRTRTKTKKTRTRTRSRTRTRTKTKQTRTKTKKTRTRTRTRTRTITKRTRTRTRSRTAKFNYFCGQSVPLLWPNVALRPVPSGLYANAMNCLWTVTAASGCVLSANFSYFLTEPTFDVLRLYDGSNILSPLLLTASGSTVPGRVFTTQNTLTAYFTSDAHVVNVGFNMNVRAVCGSDIPTRSMTKTRTRTRVATPSPMDSTGFATSTTSSTRTGARTRTRTRTVAAIPRVVCNSAVPTGTAVLISPVTSGKYLNGMNCSWVYARVSPSCWISGVFEMFATEAGYDFVTVYDGSPAAGTVILRRSGLSVPPPFAASQSTVTVQFASDASGTAAGFRLRLSEACPTNTRTRTRTRTRTLSVSQTRTQTRTRTATRTRTRSLSPSHTRTRSRVRTATRMQTRTNSLSKHPASTPSPTDGNGNGILNNGNSSQITNVAVGSTIGLEFTLAYHTAESYFYFVVQEGCCF
eukprot:TRINITY_DN401_c0_g1_i1.p1 TRINITY_DN401_c0_g1~~TRINITY_DN401_c0_g1_i1.p1  ORF type:complete len:594 (+),score=133.21 TRINITY_DN401_c0_g1_i1:210-1784(+)